MTKELLNQMEMFEIFVEKMENFVEIVKKDYLKDLNGNTYTLKDFDLRDEFGIVGSLPTTIEDYAELWSYVQKRYEEYLENCNNPLMPNEMFFDLYLNDIEANTAFYEDFCLWVFFDYEYGIYYITDIEISEKIALRDIKAVCGTIFD